MKLSMKSNHMELNHEVKEGQVRYCQDLGWYGLVVDLSHFLDIKPTDTQKWGIVLLDTGDDEVETFRMNETTQPTTQGQIFDEFPYVVDAELVMG